MVWTRLLTLELGHTTASAGAVLAAFMGGLALGAIVAGRWTPGLSPARALRIYAALEIAIAALALLVPVEISAAHPLLAVAYGKGPGGVWFSALRLGAALVIVGAPAAWMGATYPLVIIEGRAAGSLYAVNTAGAALGTLITGFTLLPRLGLFRSTLVGVAGNLLVAVVAVHLARNMGTVPISAAAKWGQSPLKMRTVPIFMALAATTVAGYSTLSLEIAWTRTLAMVMGPTTYAFTATIACFITGLALGSAGAAWLLRRRAAALPAAWLAATLALGAVAIAWAAGGVDEFVREIAARVAVPETTYADLLLAECLGAAKLLLPTAICSGAAFPLVIAMAGAASRREAAWLYSANTIGAILGALLTAMLVIPRLGLHGTMLLATAVLVLMAVVLTTLTARRWMTALMVLLLVLAATGIAARSRWDPALLSSGAYKYAAYLKEGDLELRLRAGTLNYYREGATGTVAVREVAGVRSLSIDGKVDASNGGDMVTQRLLAHLPLLARPGSSAGRVAIIGLGSGVTAGSALTYPVRQVEVIEISPEVIEAAAWFAEENRGALADPRLHLIRGDARTHFRLSSGQYDVIISEPSNPWMAGVAALFTREFFQALRSRLAPGGVVCQWTHTYDMPADDLKSIVATFSAVFPHVGTWLVGEGDLLLVGGLDPLRMRLADVRIPERARLDLVEAGVTRAAVLDQLLIGDAMTLERWLQNSALQSDDRMALEFTVPEATVGISRSNNAAALLQIAATPSAEAGIRRDAGLLALKAEAPERAWTLLGSAFEELPEDQAAVSGLLRAAAMSGAADRLVQIESRLRASLGARPDAVTPRLELARMLASRGEFDRARDLVLVAGRVAPGDHRVPEQLAAIAADAGDARALDSALALLRRDEPEAAVTSYFEAVLCMITEQPQAAIPLARAAVAKSPQHAAAWNLLGSALASSGAPTDEIRNAFARAIRADPSDPAAYANLGTLELSSGHAQTAVNWFAQALMVNPAHESAQRGLTLARAAEN